jgi:Transglycosylase SLT domain
MHRLTIIALLALSACTPTQHQAWLDWFDTDPRAAVAFARNGCGGLGCQWTDVTVSESDADIGWGQCPQWMGDALDAGWTNEQWGTLNWIMARESNCNPGAYNPSGASGLLQIMPMWIDDCGGGSLFDPGFNLSCGLHVYHQQGWGAWSVY